MNRATKKSNGLTDLGGLWKWTNQTFRRLPLELYKYPEASSRFGLHMDLPTTQALCK